jgi:macrolide transport system ATP-binding/permease protein
MVVTNWRNPRISSKEDRMGFFDRLFLDLRFAMRQLRNSWVFTTTAVAVLALGMAASIAIFAFVDAALIKPLPYQDQARLVGVFESIPLFPRSELSYPDYLDLKKLNKAFSSLDVYQSNGFVLADPNGSQIARGVRVSDGFFHTLGVVPLFGRDFFPGEDLAGAQRTVLLSYSSWQTRYGGKPDVLGKSVILDDTPNIIIGVLPPDFYFPPVGRAEFWAALHPAGGCDLSRGCHGTFGVARLNPDVTIDSALANVKSIVKQLEIQYPDSNRDQGGTVASLSNVIVGDIRPILLVLLAGAGLLLLIASTNVASLLLVRSESRRKEIAVRTSLGASRIRIVSQFFAEGFVLVAAGGVCGLVLFSWTMKLLIKLIPVSMMNRMPFWQNLGLNPHLLAFAGAIALLSVVLFSLTPTLHLSMSNGRADLAESSRGSAGNTWRRLGSKLVMVELATATVLLVGAGLLSKSLYNLLQVDLGFRPDRLVTLNITASGSVYETAPQILSLSNTILDRVERIPGVSSAGLARRGVPLDGNGSTIWFRVAVRPWHGEHYEAPSRSVSPGYFSTLGGKLSRGRYFREDDDASKPKVAIINQTMARKYFPGEDPIGKQLLDATATPGPPVEIVGIVEDIREGPLDETIPPVLYIPFRQELRNNFILVVRTAQSEAALLPVLESQIRQIDPAIVSYRGATMTEKIHDSQSAYLHRSAAWLVGGFAGLALLLGVVGLYGVIAYSVSRRTREIGIRMAVGAPRSSVYLLILKEAGWLTGAGIVGGLASSLLITTLMRTLLFRVSSWDVSTLAAVAAILAACSLSASFLPARRAAGVNPTEALRSE